MLKNKKYGGFTLLEMLVVVLIIGILAGIALPQYNKAVIKARVASILPIMRRWYDGLAEYKLRTGSYLSEDDDSPDGSEVGANWPGDWYAGEIGKKEKPCKEDAYCNNGHWGCDINNNEDGVVVCSYKHIFNIIMSQTDGYNYCGGNQGKIVCEPVSAEGEKICKSLGKPSGTNGGRQCTVIGG